MRICCFSDIHGNLEALEIFFKQRNVKEAEILIFIGDLVGYGASPNEVIEKIRDFNCIGVKGNHDYAVITGKTSWFNLQAASAIKWTRNTLSKENMRFLEDLPDRLCRSSLLLPGTFRWLVLSG